VPNAAALLKQDHRKVEKHFEQYQAGGRRVVKQICHGFTVHTAVEEELVSPLLARMSGGDELRHAAALEDLSRSEL
jgi:hypothetical protein